MDGGIDGWVSQYLADEESNFVFRATAQVEPKAVVFAGKLNFK